MESNLLEMSDQVRTHDEAGPGGVLAWRFADLCWKLLGTKHSTNGEAR